MRPFNLFGLHRTYSHVHRMAQKLYFMHQNHLKRTYEQLMISMHNSILCMQPTHLTIVELQIVFKCLT